MSKSCTCQPTLLSLLLTLLSCFTSFLTRVSSTNPVLRTITDLHYTKTNTLELLYSCTYSHCLYLCQSWPRVTQKRRAVARGGGRASSSKCYTAHVHITPCTTEPTPSESPRPPQMTVLTTSHSCTASTSLLYMNSVLFYAKHAFILPSNKIQSINRFTLNSIHKVLFTWQLVKSYHLFMTASISLYPG